MRSEWKTLLLKDTLSCIVDNRGKTPPVQDKGHILLEVNAISATEKYPQYNEARKWVSNDTYFKWFRSGHPRIGDILIPTVGTLGAVSYMNRDDCCIAQNLIAVRANPNVVDPEYLYYILRDPTTRLRLLNLNIGGVQPSIKVPHLMGLELSIPPIEVQHKISEILSSIDEQINVNNKLNDNLSSQMQAIWSNLFFSEMESGAKVSLGDCLYIKGRIGWKGLKKEEYLPDSPYRIINGESLTVSGIDWNKAGFISEDRYNESPEIMLQVGDILISKDGTIGKVGYVDRLEKPTSVASGIFVVRNLNPETVSTKFIYCLLTSSYFKEFIASRTEGSVIPHLYQKDFVTLVAPLLSQEQLRSFDDTVTPLFEMYFANQQENQRLADLRDSLLPRLMSGEIDVSDVRL